MATELRREPRRRLYLQLRGPAHVLFLGLESGDWRQAQQKSRCDPRFLGAVPNVVLVDNVQHPLPAPGVIYQVVED
jgi:hypothetical protein